MTPKQGQRVWLAASSEGLQTQLTAPSALVTSFHGHHNSKVEHSICSGVLCLIKMNRF